MTAWSTAEVLDDDQRVLRYIATYHGERGYLPTLTEIASGCAFRSRGAVRRILDGLETAGLVERDPGYPRLGIVRLPESMVARGGVRALSPVQELWLSEISVIESEGNLRALQRAMAWAPDLDALEFLLRESQDRVALLRAYQLSRDRLHAMGVRLDHSGDRLLTAARHDVEQRHEMFSDFPSYCLYSSIMTVASRRTLGQFAASLDMDYLGPVYQSEVRAYAGQRLDAKVALATWQTPSMLETVAFPVASWVGELMRRVCDRLPNADQLEQTDETMLALVSDIAR